jgi:hypothetical protein
MAGKTVNVTVEEIAKILEEIEECIKISKKLESLRYKPKPKEVGVLA